MVNAPGGSSSDNDPDPASPIERVHAARYVLIAAVAALLAGSAVWDVPAAYSAAAALAVVLVAAFVPRRPAARRAAEAALGRAPSWPEAGMTAAVDAFPQAAFVLDSAATVRFVNARAARLFPATRRGDSFTLTFRWPEIAEALQESQAGRARTLEFHEPGETTSIYSVTFSPLTLSGAGNFILVTFDDVSDRLAIARMRADFVANASHELRTPLASLTGFIETLMGPARNDPQASEKFLRIMLEQARRMRRLIDDLLSLSRAEMRVHRRPTDRADMVEVLRHVGDALGSLAREHGVAITIEAPDAVVAVVGERDELIQVFQNLIENAIRYGASGGKVDVRFDRRPDDRPELAVHVQDYGPGIPAEHLPRLTERFYRADVGASRAMKGTGLGLAIVKHILTRHQGRLEVRSRPGEGARFTVSLPLVE
ncbi:MAG: two-component sensor histidine kinase [Rhizobiales bacterium]|nr:two-component sensor histidine kinase [Hyphomicrobiales bacterium]